MSGRDAAPWVSGVVLAAGGSARFGTRVKQLAVVGGQPLVARAVEAAAAARLRQLIVVLGHAAGEVEAAIAGRCGGAVTTTVNPRWAEGQSTSVGAGLAAVDARAQAAIFLPCDQPYLTAREIDRLLTAYGARPGSIVLPVCAGRRAAPVIFDRRFFADLRALDGDVGGRALLGRHPAAVIEVPFAECRPFADVDTRADLAALDEPPAQCSPS